MHVNAVTGRNEVALQEVVRPRACGDVPPIEARPDFREEHVLQLGRRYFSQLDLLTNPTFSLLEESRVQQIRGLMGVLKQRVLLRRKAIYDKCCDLPGFSLAAVQQISSLMIGLLQSTFGSPCTNVDYLETIEKTHELFSWGGLHVPTTSGVRVPNNVPDSATIFFFPEFAHLAYENGVDVDRWRGLLPILTRMPALYLKLHELHHAESIPNCFDSFGLPPDSGSFQFELRAHARELTQRHQRMDVRTLGVELGVLASKAFSDSM